MMDFPRTHVTKIAAALSGLYGFQVIRPLTPARYWTCACKDPRRSKRLTECPVCKDRGRVVAVFYPLS